MQAGNKHRPSILHIKLRKLSSLRHINTILALSKLGKWGRDLDVYNSTVLLQNCFFRENTTHSYQNVEYLDRRNQVYCDHAQLKYVRLRSVGFAVQMCEKTKEFHVPDTFLRKKSPCLAVRDPYLTLILLTWRIWWASNNASKWQMGFNSAFKVLMSGRIKLEWISMISVLGVYLIRIGHNNIYGSPMNKRGLDITAGVMTG